MILVNQQNGRAYPLQDELVIGRNADCGIPLVDDQVSRSHARIYREGEKWFVQDLGSKNGTFVNDDQITKPTEIVPGNVIQVGDSVFRLLQEEHSQPTIMLGKEPFRARSTAAYASIDPTKCNLTHMANRVSNPAERAVLQVQLAAIAHMSLALRGLAETERIEDVTVQELLQVFPVAKRCMLVETNAKSKSLVVRAFRCRPNFEAAKVGTSSTIIDHVLKTGTAVMSSNPEAEEAYTHAASVKTYSIKAFMCAPLAIGGKPGGAIYLDTVDEKEKFSQDDLMLLALIAEQVSLNLEKARLLEELRRDKVSLQEEADRLRRQEARECDFSQIIGAAPAIQAAIERAKKVASERSTILLTGPSGTGKELFARAIHYNSPRSDKPFITVNCAAIAEQLIESELFGHVKGSFTGADKERKGQFESAHGGTLLLDEIGDMPLEAQAEVLRVLESGEVKRVGSSENISVDVRIVASTNKDLQEEIKAGRFRADLFYRLNVFPIQLPPLCERKEDILPLLNHFLRIFCTQMNKKIKGLSGEAISVLRGYAWPGNIRELKNAVERTVIEIGDKEMIGVEDLPLTGGDTVSLEKYKRIGRLPDAMKALQKEMILEALKRFGDNKTEAAEHLGLSRVGLNKMLKRLGVE